MSTYSTKTCDDCGAHYHVFCGECAQKRDAIRRKKKAELKYTLKLFKVTVHVRSGPTAANLAGLNGYYVYILHTDGPSAENKVLDALGRERVHPDKMVYTDEVKGPFTAGDILVWDEF